MTEIAKKALALVNEVSAEGNLAAYWGLPDNEITKALCRAIEQHEAYKQDVSDAVELSIDRSGHDGLRAGHINEYLGHFIIPKPTVDPLVEVIGECDDGTYGETKAEYAAKLREALAKRGLKIVEDV